MSGRASSIQQRFARFDAKNPEVAALFRQYAREMLRTKTWKSDPANVFLVLQRVIWHLRMQGDNRKIPPGFGRIYAALLANKKACYRKLFRLGVPIPLGKGQRRMIRLLRRGDASTEELVRAGGVMFSVRLSGLKDAGFVIVSRPSKRDPTQWRYTMKFEPEWSVKAVEE